MRVLTVRQPWAGLIALGRKDVENRSWVPPLDVGERFAIHAGRWDDPERWDQAGDEDVSHGLCDVRGAVLATVRLVEVTRSSQSRWAAPGHFHWVLDEPRLLRSPRYVRGQQGLWEIAGRLA